MQKTDRRVQWILYNTIVNHLRAGDFSFWDFNYGLGTNLFMLNLADPFLMLLYAAGVVFGPEHLPFYLVYYQIIKMLLAGWVCYRYLSCFPLSERVKGLCALIYAFCGYLLVWGQHYQFSTAVIFYPLILWMVEKELRNWRWGFGLALACAVSVFSSLYLSYMTLLASGIYVCFRILWMQERSLRDGVLCLLKTAGFMLLGYAAWQVSLQQLPGQRGRLDGKQQLLRGAQCVLYGSLDPTGISVCRRLSQAAGLQAEKSHSGGRGDSGAFPAGNPAWKRGL